MLPPTHRPTSPKKSRKRWEISGGPRADSSLPSSTWPARRFLISPRHAGSPERSRTAPTSAGHGLRTARGSPPAGTAPKAPSSQPAQRPSRTGVTRRPGHVGAALPGRAGRVFHHRSWRRGLAQPGERVKGGDPRKAGGRELRGAAPGGGAAGARPRGEGVRGDPPSHASAPRAAGEEAPPPRLVPTRAMRGRRSRRPLPRHQREPPPHSPRFPLPPRNPHGAPETKTTHPPNPGQRRELNGEKAREQPEPARGAGAAGGTHRGHEAARPAADTIWQRGDVSGSSCSLRSGGGAALPLPMATASGPGPPATAASSFPAALPRSRPPSLPPPPPAPPLAVPVRAGSAAGPAAVRGASRRSASPRNTPLSEL